VFNLEAGSNEAILTSERYTFNPNVRNEIAAVRVTVASRP
jgi:uncharacterized protein YegP (UPF0339 family)